MSKFIVPTERLRWSPERGSIAEKSTSSVQKLNSGLGQAGAREALVFGLQSKSRNHNIYVRGSEGTGRRRLIAEVIEELKAPPDRSIDFCYVHNFANPDRPRLLMLSGGQGHQFQQAMARISLFVRDRLPEILKNDPIRSRREARKEAAEREIRLKIAPLEKKLAASGLALMRTQSGPSSRVSIYPLVMGKPVSPEEYRNLVTQNQAREEDRLEALETARKWQSEVNKFAHEINQIWQQALQHIDQINATETARILGELTADVGRRFKAPGMDIFLREIIDDIVEKRVGRDTSHLADPTLLYGANVLTSRPDRKATPVVYANQPSVANLFGTIDPAWMSSGRAITSFRGIRTGALLEADGGVLVLDAADMLAEPGSWRMLMRSLRTGLAEVVPPELGWPYSAQSLKPEPIPLNVRVILTGTQATWEQLARDDQDFSHLFKVLADFEDTLPQDRETYDGYSRFLATQVEAAQLPHFDQSGIAAMIEYGARVSIEPGRLSARFGDLSDLAREAAARARDEDSAEVERAHVEQAAKLRAERGSLPLTQLIRAIEQGRIDISLRGRSEGRVNSVHLPGASHLFAALPVCISATAAAADSYRVVIHGQEPDNHLGLLLAHLLHLERPARLNAAIHAEPGANGADRGLDLARACSLFSALARLPLRQDLAVVGQLDGYGRVRPVQAVNQRIEAFFELCRAEGLSGQQAIVIPRSNSAELVLDHELVKACRNDMFRVFAVDSLAQALELCSENRVGVWKDENFSENSVFGRARETVLGWSP